MAAVLAADEVFGTPWGVKSGEPDQHAIAEMKTSGLVSITPRGGRCYRC